MTEIGTSPQHPATVESGPGILRRNWLYIAMVVWAVVGLAYTDIYPARSVSFWQLTTVLFGLIAVFHAFRSSAMDRTNLALKQVAHWGAFLLVMLILHSHAVTDLLTGDPLGLVTLMLLALATFLDGVYVNWRFCIVGLVLLAGVFVVAWLDDAALGLFLAGLGVVAVAVLYLMRHAGSQPAEV
jgi:hypothetical protein